METLGSSGMETIDMPSLVLGLTGAVAWLLGFIVCCWGYLEESKPPKEDKR